MESDLSIRRNSPPLLSLFPEIPCLQSERLTQQRSVHISPQHVNSLFGHHLNFHDGILNVPNNPNHASLVMEGPHHTSIGTAPFSGIPIPLIPTVAQSSKPTSDFLDFSNKNPSIQSSATVQNDSNIANNIKGEWTPNEDIELMHLVSQHGLNKWSLIANLMRGRRDAKECQERCLNHLCPPGNKKQAWTQEEEIMLIQAHYEHGNRWSEIAKTFPGRTNNAVKNHWKIMRGRNFKLISERSP